MVRACVWGVRCASVVNTLTVYRTVTVGWAQSGERVWWVQGSCVHLCQCVHQWSFPCPCCLQEPISWAHTQCCQRLRGSPRNSRPIHPTAEGDAELLPKFAEPVGEDGVVIPLCCWHLPHTHTSLDLCNTTQTVCRACPSVSSHRRSAWVCLWNLFIIT